MLYRIGDTEHNYYDSKKIGNDIFQFSAGEREQAVDPRIIVSAILNVKKRIYKDLSHVDLLLLEKEIISNWKTDKRLENRIFEIDEDIYLCNRDSKVADFKPDNNPIAIIAVDIKDP